MRKNESTAKEFIRSLRGVFGMSLRQAPPTDSFAYLENMYVDYESGGEGVESIPGYRKILSTSGRIHSLCHQITADGKFLIIHSGGNLYRIPSEETDFTEKPLPIATISDKDGIAFAFGSLVFVNDGSALYLINGAGEIIKISDDPFAVSCRKMALFDGRLFLACGDFRDRIYYSERISKSCAKLSCDSYISISSPGAEVSGLLSYGGRLWVFKSADDGDGGILSYKTEGEDYTLERVFSAISCTGEAIGFGDEIIFTTPEGVYAIENPASISDARIVCRSCDIAPMLLREELKGATLTLWRGYLALCLGEHIYLLDKRGRGKGRWYFLSGIGGYKNDRRVYRYSPVAEEGYEAYSTPHAKAEGEVIGLVTEDGRSIYYESREGRKYALYPTPEMTGGELIPPRLTLSYGVSLWFCSGEGELFLFNRGNKRDNPDFYSFAGHAPRYMAVFRPDDCDIPELTKSSVGGSLMLKLKTLPGSKAKVQVSADDKEVCSYTISAAELGFMDVDFGNLSVSAYGYCSATLPERACGWYEKQITLSSEEYSSPFGLCGVSYRYRIKDGS